MPEAALSGVRHAGEVLRLFTLDAPEWGVTEVARTLGISKSHAHRLMSSLGTLGLLDQQPGTARYRLGGQLLGMASVMLETSPLLAAASPVLRGVRKQLELPPAVAWRDGADVLCIRPCVESMLARWAPGECAAIGTVLLAGAIGAGSTGDPDFVDDVTAALGHRADELPQWLRHVRRGGVVWDYRPGRFGDCWLAAPVFDAAGVVTAALALQVPRARWITHGREIMAVLRAAAQQVTAALDAR